MKASKEIGERLKKVREASGSNSRQFSLLYKFDPSVWSRIEKGTTGLPDHYLKTILDKLHVNSNWLLTGEGNMYNIDLTGLDTSEADVNDLSTIVQTNINGQLSEERKRVPLFDIQASAGNDEVDLAPVTRATQYIELGDMLRNDSQAALYIYGNSMTPSYPPGCIVGLRQNLDGIIQPGEVYVIEIESNRLLKRLFYNDDNTGYELYSDNTMTFETGPRKGKFMYPPFEVKFETVRRIFDVTGVIKRNSNSAILQRI